MDNAGEIPFNLPFIVGHEVDYVRQAVAQGHLSGNGPFTQRCHQWLGRRLGCGDAFLTHSCTAALEMAGILIDVKPGDEVIMPSFTFVSTANAFVLRGAVPVFVDIRSDTMNIDEELIEPAITSRTRAIVAMHYAGTACAMDEIMAVAARHRLLVVEDAAQALLATYRGRYLGGIGHFGCFSFHETKNVISGEGGALIVNDATYRGRAEIVWQKGTDRSRFLRGEIDKYTWVDLGSSFSPGELTAAFLCGQFEHADRIVAARCRICRQYVDELRALAERDLLRLPGWADDCAANGHIFYIITGSPLERERLIDHLARHGIAALFHYVPLHSSPAGRQYGRVASSMEVTESISGRLLRLPLFYSMTATQVSRVAAAVCAFYGA